MYVVLGLTLSPFTDSPFSHSRIVLKTGVPHETCPPSAGEIDSLDYSVPRLRSNHIEFDMD